MLQTGKEFKSYLTHSSKTFRDSLPTFGIAIGLLLLLSTWHFYDQSSTDISNAGDGFNFIQPLLLLGASMGSLFGSILLLNKRRAGWLVLWWGLNALYALLAVRLGVILLDLIHALSRDGEGLAGSVNIGAFDVTIFGTSLLVIIVGASAHARKKHLANS